ncbi:MULTISPECIES: hypothetical protein [Pseudoalteromonas]|uniref:Uncharacterized protein n=1 Tax=Pseudoalteromonas obscura TaxID=3048491 RepID=A0ABT7EGF7_9GAMM|nr:MULTISPECIES: hypothetical protein [Pseudoalteromonas]MBQ4835618.1 hypothetical protein [Pseudoalteromonas luteoviolacea]MDK2594131.1 hypothetical protein [Pseudoalteromonas sp. P94(2023)]
MASLAMPAAASTTPMTLDEYIAMPAATSATPMTLDEYIAHASSIHAIKCKLRRPGAPVGPSEVIFRNNFARDRGLITDAAAQWGSSNGYYPVIDAFVFIISGICKA